MPNDELEGQAERPLVPTVQPSLGWSAGLRVGLRAPLKGVSFLARRSDLWLHAAVPTAIAMVILTILGSLSIKYLPTIPPLIVGSPATWYGQIGVVAGSIAITAVGIILSFALALVIAQPLSGPTLEHLARALEADIGAADRPKVPAWRQMGRSAGGVIIGLAIGLPLLAVLTVVTLIFPVLSWITFPLKLLVLGVMVTWDLMDYPFTVRGWSLPLRAGWMRQNLYAVVGFGVALGIVMLIPCVQLLLLPVGAVGATWLYHEVDRLR